MAYAMNYNSIESDRINRSYNSNGIYEYDRVYNKGD